MIYLDNAATTQKPKSVINRIKKYYEKENANVHRGLYKLSENATKLYENARIEAAKFVNADNAVFTSNATEAFNILAYTIGKNQNVVITIMEHHSNFVPWQQLSKIKIAGIKNYELDEQDLLSKINKNTKILSLTYVSNVLGSKNNLEKIIAKVRKINNEIIIVVDATQAVPNFKVDMKKIGADIIIYSGHKMYGPTGIGVMAINQRIIEQLKPFNYGGSMIKNVTKKKTEFAEFPQNMEAGTPNIAGAIGLTEAIKYVKGKHPKLVSYALKKLRTVPGLKIIGKNQVSLISFTIQGIHPHDIASMLDEKNICVRAGHHCSQPLMQELKIIATTRISFGMTNTKKEIDILVKELKNVVRKFL